MTRKILNWFGKGKKSKGTRVKSPQRDEVRPTREMGGWEMNGGRTRRSRASDEEKC